ncbi:MauE/DoxX family redox-associated membrane protein [[Flexibacter] sp. ATCC 35208]|uniref:MauE/DoxX family redox-associated membrane protein n=1 Tax=[Flexibacter] sp. ATCC 35208 TaxID=1936242 RepID=UPI0009D4C6C0|nr:MauE/DoxX family redox-associated membrane protein [[Flexibacter] sp. ATCC 35208]OMP80131.1 hypothetical protein BW716_06460 [[Flexibacter] sp. ATCC 35208]
MKRSLLIDVAAVLYMSLFIYAALSKLSKFELGREQLTLMPLIGSQAMLLAWLVPATEIAISILIFLPQTRKIGFYAATLLMVSFTVYIIYIIRKAQSLPCTCGGLLEMLSWPQHLFFNIAFILLGVTALIFMRMSSKGQGSLLKANSI